MLALLQLLLPKRATKQRVAVGINTPGKVLARHANLWSPEGDEMPLVYPGAFLHRVTLGTDVLTPVHRGAQGSCASTTRISLTG